MTSAGFNEIASRRLANNTVPSMQLALPSTSDSRGSRTRWLFIPISGVKSMIELT
jgi:hypothetical protein